MQAVPAAPHQALQQVVRDPELLQRFCHAVQIFDFLDLISAQRQSLQVVQARQAADLLNVVRGEGQIPESASKQQLGTSTVASSRAGPCPDEGNRSGGRVLQPAA